MNMNLKLDLNMDTLRRLLPGLKKAQPYFYGLIVVGLFGYTAYTINKDLNVQPAQAQSVIQPLPKIVFDKTTITTLKSLNSVGGSVPLGSLGSNNPFN
jgi:hypothetical protein